MQGLPQFLLDRSTSVRAFSTLKALASGLSLSIRSSIPRENVSVETAIDLMNERAFLGFLE